MKEKGEWYMGDTRKVGGNYLIMIPKINKNHGKFLIRLGGHNCDVPGTHHKGFSNLKRNDSCLWFYRNIFFKKNNFVMEERGIRKVQVCSEVVKKGDTKEIIVKTRALKQRRHQLHVEGRLNIFTKKKVY